MAKGDPLLSPWTWDSGADYLGRHMSITLPFNNTTRAITNGGVIHRDAGCMYTKIVWGVPTSPTSIRSASVPNGDTAISAAQVRALGFDTIEQVLALQITAEP